MRRQVPVLALACVATLILTALPVAAQVVERNLPPTAPHVLQPIAPPAILRSEDDPTPIGPAVRAVVLLGPTDPGRAEAPDGVSSTPGLQLSADEAARTLRPLLGGRLSHRLIAQAQAAVARRYRALGYPFLAVTVPEQEVTGGVLQLRVIPFKVGRVGVEGVRNAAEAQAVAARVRLQPGDPIYAPGVSDDLDWLGRDPFRKVSPTFARGDGLGLTDVRLQVQEARPWSLYAGYANSGSPSTGTDRYFAGAQAGGLLGFGSLLSYQGTASDDALFDEDRPFSSADRPRYVSHAGRLSLQPFPRMALEIAADYVDTNQPVQDFLIAQKTWEASIDLRFALSALSPRLGAWGDARVGVAGKRQETRTLFSGVDVAEAAVEDYQLQMGWSRAEVDRFGRSDLDLLVHLSPGGVDPANGGDRIRGASQGRLHDARYAYVSGSLDRMTRLPGGWAWRLQALGQYAAEPLPSTEQAGLGQQSLVRGYTLDDGAYDRAFVLRDELRAPAMSPIPGWIDGLGPYAFADVGRATRLAGRFSQTASSLGLGAAAALASRLSVDVDVARALQSAPSTRAGDWRLETRLSVAF